MTITFLKVLIERATGVASAGQQLFLYDGVMLEETDPPKEVIQSQHFDSSVMVNKKRILDYPLLQNGSTITMLQQLSPCSWVFAKFNERKFSLSIPDSEVHQKKEVHKCCHKITSTSYGGTGPKLM